VSIFFAEPGGFHRRVLVNYRIRTGAFAWCFVVLALHAWEHNAGPGYFGALALLFLVYPHVAYLRARYSTDSKRAEEYNLYVDAAMLGSWIAMLHFPIWIFYAAVFSTTLNATVLGGLPGGLRSLFWFSIGVGVVGLVLGVQVMPETSALVSALCFVGSLAYSCAVGYVVYTQGNRLTATRDELRGSEERYRLIAENAADLIAMVDDDGRWLYTSPSYQRVLDKPDLEVGVDAFRRVHPDDAERARVAMARAGTMGKPRDVALRLVDRGGRIRQYRTHIQAIGTVQGAPPGAGKPAPRLLLTSLDVTDLRESEERLLVAAHALEGMTEAIVIAAADGLVASVNRAFSELTGWTRDEVVGQPEAQIRNALQPAAFYDEVYATVDRAGYWSGSTWAKKKGGALYREWRSIRAVRDAAGAVTHYVQVFYDAGAPKPGVDSTNPSLRG
jgi:PAS domain S-box-containing protein